MRAWAGKSSISRIILDFLSERYQNADILFKKNVDHVFKKNADRFKINADMFKKNADFCCLKKTRTAKMAKNESV